MLEHIELNDNKLTQVPNFKELAHLTYLDLRDNALTNIDAQSFVGIAISTELFVSQHEICNCFVPVDLKCDASGIRSPYLTCERLLSDRSLVILIWFIGVNALCGNLFVVIWRHQTKIRKFKIQQASDQKKTKYKILYLAIWLYLIY